MYKSVKRDGTVVEWTGLSTCYCVKCEVVFNSQAAFDLHLKRETGKGGGVATHDYSGMPVNEKGYFVTAAWDTSRKAQMPDRKRRELAAEE